MMEGFWDWAVTAYGREGVAAAGLELQDVHGQCVPLLLWGAWQQARDVALSGEDAVRAVAVARPWADEVVGPLRQVRRRLKQALAGDDPAAREGVRDSVKAAELAAERTLMERLEGLTVAAGGAGDNLSALVSAWSGTAPPQELVKLTQALTKGQKMEYDGG